MTRWTAGLSRLLADRRYPRGRILGASAVAVSGAADTNENTLATITIPAGAMGLNGYLRITTWWTFTSSANNKITKFRFGGIGGTAFHNVTVTTVAGGYVVGTLANKNSASAQSGSAIQSYATGTSLNLVQALTVDTSAATTLVITGQKASAGETLTLESYLVELILP